MVSIEILCDALAGGGRALSLRDPALADAVIDAAVAHGVAGLLAEAIGQAWTGAARARLLAEASSQLALEAAQRIELGRVVDALGGAGVRALVFKGAHLAYSVYPSPALRPRRDLDLLIAPSAEPEVRSALESLGYTPAVEPRSTLASSQFHYGCLDRSGASHACDVHLRPVNPHVLADAIGYQEIAARAVPIPGLGPHARGPSAADALILACMHRAAHHFGSERLIWLYDIHLLVHALSRQELDDLLTRVQRPSLRLVCARGILDAAARLRTRISDASRRTLEQLAAEGRGDPVGVFLSGKTRQVDVLLSDVRALPAWRARARLLREHILPPAAYLRARYRPGARLLGPFLYAYRLCRGLPRWFRTSQPGRD